MGNPKINMNMGLQEVVLTMCENNHGALMIVLDMINRPESFLDLLLCDSLDIRGVKLYLLYNDCCNRNKGKFNRTLLMIRHGIFTEEEIHQNLSLNKAVPFIDDEMNLNGIPTYDEKFNSIHPKWNEYCSIQREIFIGKLQKTAKRG